MSSPLYFFDTYAFFEILRGSPAYRPYAEANAITTIFNLAELNYNLKSRQGAELADKWTDAFKKFLVPVEVVDIKKSMELRVSMKTLSIPDAIGYTVARRHGVKFLTGDEDFRNMPQVEFIK